MKEISLNSTINYHDRLDGEIFDITQVDHDNDDEEETVSMTREVAIELAYKILEILEDK